VDASTRRIEAGDVEADEVRCRRPLP